MTEATVVLDGFLSDFTVQRRRLLTQAGAILSPDPPASPARTESLSIEKLAALLITSLEELKVVEEELHQQQEAIIESRDTLEREKERYRLLFDLAPGALVLTTKHGSIREANRTATELLGRTAYHLRGKPLATMIPAGERVAFREMLNRLNAAGDRRICRLCLERRGNGAIHVDALVEVVHSPTGEAALYWHFGVPEAAAAG